MAIEALVASRDWTGPLAPAKLLDPFAEPDEHQE